MHKDSHSHGLCQHFSPKYFQGATRNRATLPKPHLHTSGSVRHVYSKKKKRKEHYLFTLPYARTHIRAHACPHARGGRRRVARLRVAHTAPSSPLIFPGKPPHAFRENRTNPPFSPYLCIIRGRGARRNAPARRPEPPQQPAPPAARAGSKPPVSQPAGWCGPARGEVVRTHLPTRHNPNM